MLMAGDVLPSFLAGTYTLTDALEQMHTSLVAVDAAHPAETSGNPPWAAAPAPATLVQANASTGAPLDPNGMTTARQAPAAAPQAAHGASPFAAAASLELGDPLAGPFAAAAAAVAAAAAAGAGVSAGQQSSGGDLQALDGGVIDGQGPEQDDGPSGLWLPPGIAIGSPQEGLLLGGLEGNAERQEREEWQEGQERQERQLPESRAHLNEEVGPQDRPGGGSSSQQQRATSVLPQPPPRAAAHTTRPPRPPDAGNGGTPPPQDASPPAAAVVAAAAAGDSATLGATSDGMQPAKPPAAAAAGDSWTLGAGWFADFADRYLAPPTRSDQLSLFSEVQRLVARKGLVPVLHCTTRRMLFQMPFDDSIRLTIDTDVHMLALDEAGERRALALASLAARSLQRSLRRQAGRLRLRPAQLLEQLRSGGGAGASAGAGGTGGGSVRGSVGGGTAEDSSVGGSVLGETVVGPDGIIDGGEVRGEGAGGAGGVTGFGANGWHEGEAEAQGGPPSQQQGDLEQQLEEEEQEEQEEEEEAEWLAWDLWQRIYNEDVAEARESYALPYAILKVGGPLWEMLSCGVA